MQQDLQLITCELIRDLQYIRLAVHPTCSTPATYQLTHAIKQQPPSLFSCRATPKRICTVNASTALVPIIAHRSQANSIKPHSLSRLIDDKIRDQLKFAKIQCKYAVHYFRFLVYFFWFSNGNFALSKVWVSMKNVVSKNKMIILFLPILAYSKFGSSNLF